MIEGERVRVRTKGLVAVMLIAVLAACSSGSDSDESASTTLPPPVVVPETLTVLVTNDDGFAADGIDVLVEALRELPSVNIIVVAPSVNRSGTGSQTTPPPLTVSDQETKSGYPVVAVEGFPADTIAYALSDVLPDPPELVVAGINEGQNLGPIASISGTVGAAKAAAAAGIPALAVSSGLGETPDYTSAASLVVEWVQARKKALVRGRAAKVVVNLNVPTCPIGAVRGLKQVPLSTTATGIAPAPDCNATTTTFANDVEAFLAGFASVTELTPTGETVTTSTTWPQPE